MNDKELCQWLRDNSSGVYRPCKAAADRMEELLEALNEILEVDHSESEDAYIMRGIVINAGIIPERGY